MTKVAAAARRLLADLEHLRVDEHVEVLAAEARGHVARPRARVEAQLLLAQRAEHLAEEELLAHEQPVVRREDRRPRLAARVHRLEARRLDDDGVGLLQQRCDRIHRFATAE